MDLGIIYGERLKQQLKKTVAEMLEISGVDETMYGEEVQKLSEAIGALVEETVIAWDLAKIKRQGVDFTLRIYVAEDSMDWQMYREEGAQAPASPYFFS